MSNSNITSYYDKAYTGSKSSMDNIDDSLLNDYEEEDDYAKLDRAEELKKKELFRQGKLEYEDNGELIQRTFYTCYI